MKIGVKVVSINPKTQNQQTEEIQQTEEKTKNTAIQMVEDIKENDSSAQANSISTKKLTLDNFKQSVVEEYQNASGESVTFEKLDDSFVINRFKSLIKTMSDEEKEQKFDFVLSNFETKPILIAEFIKSIKDTKLASKCAAKVTLQQLYELNKTNIEASLEIAKLLPKDKLIEFIRQNDKEFDKLYTSDTEIVERVLDKIQKGETIKDEKELKIKEQLEKCANARVLFQIAAYESTVLSNEEKEQVKFELKKGEEKYPSSFKNLYAKSLADFVSKYKDSLNSYNEYKDELDKITDNKFSEELNKISEKNAVDETGNFKTVSEEVIAKSEEKIQAIKQNIEKASASEPIVVETKNSKSETANTSDSGIITYESITGDNGTDIIKDIFTGKIKVSEYLEQVAIKKYKLMDTAMQGNILLNATGEFFNDLVQNLETSTFEHLLSIGWKGRSYDATQKVKNEVEERKNDVA